MLRRYTLRDVDDLVALYADPEVKRFIPVTGGYGRDRATERVLADQREWEELGHRMLAIVESASGRFLGRVAIYDWAETNETEVGWVLRADARGRGFATEAGRACIAWAFANLPVPYVTAMIDPDNVASINVATRLGMSVLRHDRLFGRLVVVHAISRAGERAIPGPGGRL